MKAVYAQRPEPRNPLAALQVGEQPDPTPVEQDWTVVDVRAAALNHRDIWTLKGAGPAARYPIILGFEGSGVDDTGRDVIIWGVTCAREWAHDPNRDPNRRTLGDDHPGTFAERVAVPRTSLVDKPAAFSHAEASCVTGTWHTAYRMLFTKADLTPGDTVLIQGAGGGVSTALIRLAGAAGLRTWVTSRDRAKRRMALDLGADAVFPTQSPLPEPVDAVMESVGQATWAHSIRSLRPGGTLVITGATTGGTPPALLNRIFWNELRIVGSTSGTRDELDKLIKFMLHHNLRPDIDRELPFADAEEGFRRLIDGSHRGKIVFVW